MDQSGTIAYGPAALLPRMRAERLRCALQDRVIGLGLPGGGRLWRGILLSAGNGAAEIGDDVLVLSGPCLAWLPWNEGRVLRIGAGSVGYQLVVDNEVLAGAIGNDPEATNFRYVADRRMVASLQGEDETSGDAQAAFDLIVRELGRPRNGSWTMVQAQVRSLLVLLWRLSGIEDVAVRSAGEASRILQRFRQLLEMHFQDRWTIRSYAEAIGISHDRLHDICRRELGRSPLQLVHERTVHEAKMRLERSILTVEQISISLGFRDVGHFSRFFKAKTGLPPGAYRAKVAAAPIGSGDGVRTTYADWP